MVALAVAFERNSIAFAANDDVDAVRTDCMLLLEVVTALAKRLGYLNFEF